MQPCLSGRSDWIRTALSGDDFRPGGVQPEACPGDVLEQVLDLVRGNDTRQGAAERTNDLVADLPQLRCHDTSAGASELLHFGRKLRHGDHFAWMRGKDGESEDGLTLKV